MKKLLVMVALIFMVGAPIYGQSVKREGKVFVEQDTKKEPTSNAKKTEFTYKAKDGKTYPIYLSKNGKAFIVRTSKKSGKEYRQYLPEVTEQLNKK